MPTLDLRPTPDSEGNDSEVEASEQEAEAEKEPAAEADQEEADSNDASEAAEDPAEGEDDEEREAKAIEALKAQKQSLLKEIVQLRQDKRQAKESKPEDDKPIMVQDDLKDVNPGDVDLIEKVLKAKGYIRKDEVTSLTVSQQIRQEHDRWLKEHPEYLPENDPNDEKWSMLKQEVETYYRSPSSPEQMRRILDKAHSEISPKPTIPNKPKSSVDAKKERLKAVSKASAGSAQSGKSATQRIDSSMKAYLHGFDDGELDELMG